MAGAEIIATAMAILLLVVVSYVVVGSIITSGEITASAQKDYTLLKESQVRTVITIQALYSEKNLTVKVTNTGNEIIGDFEHMDIFVNKSTDPPVRHYFNTTGLGVAWDSWNCTGISPTTIHPGILDPSETMTVEIEGFNEKPSDATVRVITPNGVWNSTNIP